MEKQESQIKNMQHVTHPFEPFYDSDSQILILGSFPSVKSREQKFFYGHPQNRFWKVIAKVFDDPVPVSIPEKKELLRRHHIALWDVIHSCDIKGSSDASITNVIPNDLSRVLAGGEMKTILVNGKTAEKYYNKYIRDGMQREAICMPSTSPANAAWSLDRLITAWREGIRKKDLRIE